MENNSVNDTPNKYTLIGCPWAEDLNRFDSLLTFAEIVFECIPHDSHFDTYLYSFDSEEDYLKAEKIQENL